MHEVLAAPSSRLPIMRHLLSQSSFTELSGPSRTFEIAAAWAHHELTGEQTIFECSKPVNDNLIPLRLRNDPARLAFSIQQKASMLQSIVGLSIEQAFEGLTVIPMLLGISDQQFMHNCKGLKFFLGIARDQVLPNTLTAFFYAQAMMYRPSRWFEFHIIKDSFEAPSYIGDFFHGSSFLSKPLRDFTRRILVKNTKDVALMYLELSAEDRFGLSETELQRMAYTDCLDRVSKSCKTFGQFTQHIESRLSLDRKQKKESKVSDLKFFRVLEAQTRYRIGHDRHGDDLICEILDFAERFHRLSDDDVFLLKRIQKLKNKEKILETVKGMDPKPLYIWCTTFASRMDIDVSRLKRSKARAKNPSCKEHFTDTISVPFSLNDFASVDFFQSALDSLSPDLRDAIQAIRIEGSSHEEHAAMRGIPIGTSKTRLHRALNEYRGKLSVVFPELRFK